MAWQPYIDQHLVGSGHVTKAAIFGLDGALWAQSIGWIAVPAKCAAEIKILVSSCNEKDTSFPEKGIIFNGTKYIFTSRPTGASAAGKKGATGVVLAKTKKAIIIAFYDDKIQPGNCVTTTLKIADYLSGQNY